MKKFLRLNIIVALCLLITSCYDNETVIIDESEEANLSFGDELTALMKSVTSHDASFDDFIDEAPCFSINFPYQVIADEQLMNIETIEDVADLSDFETEIEIVFPIGINLSNYDTHTVSSEIQLESLRQMCNDGFMYGDNINCADFIYPLKLAIYNTGSRRFIKVEFNSNRETFLFLDMLDNNSIFALDYPANILMYEEEHFSINNNFSLSTHFKIAHNTCGNPD